MGSLEASSQVSRLRSENCYKIEGCSQCEQYQVSRSQDILRADLNFSAALSRRQQPRRLRAAV